MAKIAVIGSGYVGLTTGACLAELGHDVVCIDIDVEKVEQLSRGKLTIFEDGLEALVKNGIKNKSLKFAVDAQEAVANSDFIYFCLPTPESRDGSADISAVKKVATELGPFVKRDSVIVNKSTLPVGSVREVEKWIGRNDVFVVSNPEFLREGSAVGDFMNPDRVVIGADNRAAAERVAQIYEP
ncbi:MAG: NAD(P)-binding domain-containing protein, partial [Actinomycetota bacterium]